MFSRDIKQETAILSKKDCLFNKKYFIQIKVSILNARDCTSFQYRPNSRLHETKSDWCAPRFQTTGRLHGNAQRWESNKAINNFGHSLVQDKIEVEGALTGPFLLLLLLLSLQLSFHRDAEWENSQQSQSEEHASLRPRHLSRFLLTSPTLWQTVIFTFSIYHLFLNRLCVNITLFLGVLSSLSWVHSAHSSLVQF